MQWDLLLYVPTVTALALIALKLWFGPNHTWSYLLLFLASFFFIAGVNRILSSRLMLLPSSVVALNINKQRMDLSGKQRQYVLHRGQFADDSAFKEATTLLKVYK